MILDQRSDVEWFFLEALEQVKHEAKSKVKTSTLPDITDSRIGQSNLGTTRDYGEKAIQLKDLDWEDRERILRLLFSKMNSGLQCSNWRNPEPERYEDINMMEKDDDVKPWSGHPSEVEGA